MGGRRKTNGGRVTPKVRRSDGRLTPAEKAGLEGVFAKVLDSAPEDLHDDLPAIAVEMWASQLWSIWHRSDMVDMDAEAVFAGGLIAHAAGRTTPSALVVLRGLETVAPEPYRTKARRAADRLAATGVPEPTWAGIVGRAAPTEAWLSHDPVDDDGVSIIVGFDGPGGADTVGVYVDHNLGGMAKDVFAVLADVDELLTELRANAEFEGVEYRPIPLTSAADRWSEALAITDMTFEPPVDADVHRLRGLVLARLATMPDGGAAPADVEVEVEVEALAELELETEMDFDEDERERLLTEFLESDETVGLWGFADGGEAESTVQHLAVQVMTFSLDYVLGTPLRFSPVMAEMFCLDWAPRKIAADEEAFTLLPDVLAAWIRFVGRRRGIPEESIGEAVEAAYGYAPEMIEMSGDPSYWGPAKTMALAIDDRGIDITDETAVKEFIDEVNRNGGIDVLAGSLVGSPRPRR
jgi:hypothetical protein